MRENQHRQSHIGPRIEQWNSIQNVTKNGHKIHEPQFCVQKKKINKKSKTATLYGCDANKKMEIHLFSKRSRGKREVRGGVGWKKKKSVYSESHLLYHTAAHKYMHFMRWAIRKMKLCRCNLYENHINHFCTNTTTEQRYKVTHNYVFFSWKGVQEREKKNHFIWFANQEAPNLIYDNSIRHRIARFNNNIWLVRTKREEEKKNKK